MPPAHRLPEGVDLVTTTGGVGYVTERTFDGVLGARRGGSTPWVPSFGLWCGLVQTWWDDSCGSIPGPRSCG